jgi:hypothetical protein
MPGATPRRKRVGRQITLARGRTSALHTLPTVLRLELMGPPSLSFVGGRKPADLSELGPGAESQDKVASAGLQDEAKEEVFLNEDLMKLVFSHLCLEDLCKAGMARKRWHDITNNPAFWRVIDLEGKTLSVPKVSLRGLVNRLPVWHSGCLHCAARCCFWARSRARAANPRLGAAVGPEGSKGL